MGVFFLKYRDTRPVLRIRLKNPDGSNHDYTGYTALKLHIRLNNGTTLTRTMVGVGLESDGLVEYEWQSTDWDAGNLITGPVPPLSPTAVEHKMEVEVITASSRTTFPNNGYDILRILPDFANG